MESLNKWLVISACAALLVLSGCKARKVNLLYTDSTTTTTLAKSSSTFDSHLDTSKVTTERKTTTTDTGSYLISITPKAGQIITVTGNGTFTGEASNVTVKGKKAINKRTDEQSTINNGVTDTHKVDSAAQQKQVVHVEKKIKTVDSKPDYCLIWWAAGGLIILGFAFVLYRKFF